jgi:hypothetical protein
LPLSVSFTQNASLLKLSYMAESCVVGILAYADSLAFFIYIYFKLRAELTLFTKSSMRLCSRLQEKHDCAKQELIEA